jgi:hypothetical protein
MSFNKRGGLCPYFTTLQAYVNIGGLNMSTVKNESIETIFYEYANTDEYENAVSLINGEVVSWREKLDGRIQALTPTRKEAIEISDEVTQIISVAEKVGFILGFKYAFKLQVKHFQNKRNT